MFSKYKMFRRPEVHVSGFFEKLSIAWEYARAREWSREWRLKTLERSSVGETVTSVESRQKTNLCPKR
jgi:hypothetical protein